MMHCQSHSLQQPVLCGETNSNEVSLIIMQDTERYVMHSIHLQVRRHYHARAALALELNGASCHVMRFTHVQIHICDTHIHVLTLPSH